MIARYDYKMYILLIIINNTLYSLIDQAITIKVRILLPVA